MRSRQSYLFPLILSSLTLMVVVFLLWELIQRNFFLQLDTATLHFLYISRGAVLGALMAVWSVWFVSRYRSKYEQEQARLQAQLFQAEKLTAMGELVAGVAHEINNPIGVMTSRIELMLGEAGEQRLSRGHQKDLEVLHKHASRVGSIARALLSFARKSGTEKAEVDLNQVVASTVPLVEHELEKKGIALELHLGARLPRIQGNFNQLQQVLLNLLTNARDALWNGGKAFPEARIQVGTWRVQGEEKVRMCVVDNGPGIASEHLNRVFDPFFTTKETGTGLGLSVSYGIAKEHGGTLEATGEREGKFCGTCFAMTLPASDISGGTGP